MRHTKFVAVFAILCSALFAPANAQRTPGVTLSIMMGSSELHFHTFGWKGIEGDDIGANRVAREIIETVHKPGKDVLPRWLVDFVCNDRCPELPPWREHLRYPDDKGNHAKTTDLVVWKDGARTRGRVDVHCPNENDQCQVYQDGKPVHPNGGSDWRDVSYVEFAWVERPL